LADASQGTPEPGSAEALTRLFVVQVLSNPANRAILQRLPALGLPDAWLVAGCLFQTVWNLGVTLEVKNQARVHTWYEARFGSPYSPLHSATEGIDRFLVDGTCVGLQAHADGLRLYAPPMDWTA